MAKNAQWTSRKQAWLDRTGIDQKTKQEFLNQILASDESDDMKAFMTAFINKTLPPEIYMDTQKKLFGDGKSVIMGSAGGAGSTLDMNKYFEMFMKSRQKGGNNTQQQGAAIFCTNCGAQLESGFAFCSNCGTKVEK
jgi:hypothetical protein